MKDNVRDVPSDKARNNCSDVGALTGLAALTTAGFLVVEGIICVLSKQPGMWYRYLWFAFAAAGTTVLFAALFRLLGKRQSAYTVLRVLLESAIGIYLALAVVYLAYLFSIGSSPDMFYYIIVPLLILATTLVIQIGSMRKTFGAMEEPIAPDRTVVLPEVWKIAAAMSSFALLIVLAFAWSWTSPLGHPVAPVVAAEDYRILYGIIGAMWRLLLLSVIHAVFLYLSGVHSLPARTVQIVCWSALAVWRYAPVLLTAVQGPRMQYSFLWTLSVVAPGVYASVLTSRLVSRLPKVNKEHSVTEQKNLDHDRN